MVMVLWFICMSLLTLWLVIKYPEEKRRFLLVYIIVSLETIYYFKY